MKELALAQEHHQQLAEDEQELTARPLLRRAARARGRDAANQGSTAPGGDVGVAGLFSQAINAGLGHALPDNLRETFETSLGTSLSDVRVHTDGHAAASADAFDAHAFAHGQNIFFGAGQYRPGTPDGDQLIAHEVAHTVQQRGAAPTTQHKLAISEPGDAMEHAADAAAVAMTRGERTGVGSAGLTIARQSRGATQAQPAANAAQPAAGGQTIAQRFPQGITVAIALQSAPERDRAANAKREPRKTLAWYMSHVGEQLPGDLRTTRLLRDAYAAADHGERPITDVEADALAHSLWANDQAFERAAISFAQSHPVVGGDGSSPALGRPITFLETENAVAKILAVSRGVGPLPGVPGGGNIKHLAIFTHGWHDNIRLGTFHGGASAFVSQLGGALTHDVTVGIYGCSAASGEGSFAQNVTEGLAQGGHDARVFGHEDPAHTTDNPRGREFLARAGQAHAISNTTYELVFAAAFRARQIADIAGQIGVTPAAVAQVFDNAAGSWLVSRHTGLFRIHTAHGQTAAFQMGFDPAGAVRAAQATWLTEGVGVIRRALVHPPNAPRFVTNTHIGRDTPLPDAPSASPAPAETSAAEPTPAAESTPAAHASLPENRVTAPAPHAAVPEDRASMPADHATIPEDRAPATQTQSQKPAMDPHAKDKAPMAPHAKDAAARRTNASTTSAPTAAAPTAADGPLAIVQRPGPLHPRHPGNGMDLHAAPGSRQAVEHIMPGTFVHIVRREGDWTLVSHRGRQGWVANNTLHDAPLGQQDVREEAEYHVAAAETQNNAAQYTDDAARVNIGFGSWTGRRIGTLLGRYRALADEHGELAAMNAHFDGHLDQLVSRFTQANMDQHYEVVEPDGRRRMWTGPRLSEIEQGQFRTLEARFPYIREAEEEQLRTDIDRYLRWLVRDAYPFIAADRTVSEVALNVAISAYHQGGMHIDRANAHFGAPVTERTTEIDYLAYLGSIVDPRTRLRYRQILSQYGDSPRRYPVP